MLACPLELLRVCSVKSSRLSKMRMESFPHGPRAPGDVYITLCVKAAIVIPNVDCCLDTPSDFRDQLTRLVIPLLSRQRELSVSFVDISTSVSS